MDISCDIYKAIEIIEGIRNGELALFDDRISRIFNELHLPSDCPIESIIQCAKKGVDFIYKGKTHTFDKGKNGYDNLFKWAFDIEPEPDIQWDNIDKEQQESFWNLLGRFDYFKNDRKLIFDGFEKDFYEHINKSLLKAEYLFCDDYKKFIRDEVEKLGTQKDATGKYPAPQFFKSFIIIASHLCDLCWRIENAIDYNNNRRIIIETHPEEKANTLENIYSFTPSDSNDIYFHFTQSVIKMTVIDHIYKSTSDNISKLVTLWDRIKNVESIIDQDLVKIIKAKTATLLHQMLEKWKEGGNENLTGLEDVNFFYSAGTKNNVEIKDDIDNHKLSKTGNGTINIKNNHNDKIIKYDELPHTIIGTSTTGLNDIKRYNEWVKKGQEYYCDKSDLISKIKDNIEIETIIEKTSYFNKYHSNENGSFSPYYFLRVLDFIEKKYRTNDDNNLKIQLLDLLQDTLNCIKKYIDTYENRMPPVFRPYFEHSFYQFDENNTRQLSLDIESIKNYPNKFHENSFFFASYDCNAININRLKNKYEQYIVLYTSWSTQFSKNLYDKSSKLESKIKEQEKSIKDEKEFIEKLKENLEKETKTQKEEIKRTQQSSLQTLGLFAAFIAIIVSSIGTFRVVSNIWEYIIYSLTYTLAIALFAFLISNRTEKKEIADKDKDTEDKDKDKGKDTEDKDKGKGIPWYKFRYYAKEWAFILSFGFLAIVSIFYFTKHHFTKDIPEATNGVSVSIDNSYVPNSTVSLESVLPNDADTLNNATTTP